MTARFTVRPGKNYPTEYSNDLVTWSQLSDLASFTAAVGANEQIDDGSQTGGLNFFTTQRFYRVGLQ